MAAITLKFFSSGSPGIPMGSSGRLQLQLLLFGQTITWLGLGVSVYWQWENRATLRELQWLGDIPSSPRGPELLGEGKLNRVSSAGGGGGGSDPPSGFGSHPYRPSGEQSEPVVHRVHTDRGHTLSFTSFLILGWVLLIVAVTVWIVKHCWHTVSDSDSNVGSPSERQRAVAQRQLAELRLRHNGFTQ